MLRQCIALTCLSMCVSAWGAGTPNAAIHTGWQSVGPAPGAIEAAVLVDSTARIVYIGSVGGGVLKSTDGGATFTAMNNGLGALTVAAMAMAPDNPDVVYASTLTDVYKTGDGVFKSTDGAESWAPINTDLGDLNVYGLALDLDSPSTIYVSTSSSVYKSTTGGR